MATLEQDAGPAWSMSVSKSLSFCADDDEDYINPLSSAQTAEWV